MDLTSISSMMIDFLYGIHGVTSGPVCMFNYSTDIMLIGSWIKILSRKINSLRFSRTVAAEKFLYKTRESTYQCSSQCLTNGRRKIVFQWKANKLRRSFEKDQWSPLVDIEWSKQGSCADLNNMYCEYSYVMTDLMNLRV